MYVYMCNLIPWNETHCQKTRIITYYFDYLVFRVSFPFLKVRSTIMAPLMPVSYKGHVDDDQHPTNNIQS